MDHIRVLRILELAQRQWRLREVVLNYIEEAGMIGFVLSVLASCGFDEGKAADAIGILTDLVDRPDLLTDDKMAQLGRLFRAVA